MQDLKAKDVISEMESQLEEITNTDEHVIETCSVNECWWQGDLGVQYLGNDIGLKPDGTCNYGQLKKLDKQARFQLAEGNTVGSQHVLENTQDCDVYELLDSSPLVGYIIHAKQNGCHISHPTHGDVRFNVSEEGSFNLIRFQRQYAEELRRAAD